MARRSLFQMIFGTNQQDQTKYQTQLQLLNGFTPQWSAYNGQLYDSSLVRACIDAIARNGAKLSPKHIRKIENGYEFIDDKVQHIISKQPNSLMNAYDFYYKVISELELNNNAFIYISRDEYGTPKELYPLTAGYYTLLEYNNNVFIRFNFNGGQSYVASVKDDVIFLRKFFCKDELIGANNNAVVKAMSLRHVVDEGIINAIKTTSTIRGYVKSTKAMLKAEDVKQIREDFIDSFENKKGIGGLDATSDFHQVNLTPQTTTDSQLKRIDDEIKNYFSVNDKIIQSSYTEDEWNAFYESVIEPIAIQLSLEFTNKLFSYGERWHGNEILFEANRLQYASNKTKISIIKEAGALGILTINECRTILNLSPIEDGDKRVQSLNYTDKDGNNNE